MARDALAKTATSSLLLAFTRQTNKKMPEAPATNAKVRTVSFPADRAIENVNAATTQKIKEQIKTGGSAGLGRTDLSFWKDVISAYGDIRFERCVLLVPDAGNALQVLFACERTVSLSICDDLLCC